MNRLTASLATRLFAFSTFAPAAFARTTFDVQCMQTAVEKRESTFISAFDAYYASVRTAMISRKDAVKSAWAITDSTQRENAIRNADKNFTTSERAAKKVRRDAEKVAAKIFKNEAALCEINS